MSQNKNVQPQQVSSQASQLPVHVIEQFIKTQNQKALNEAEEIKIRSKDIDYQSKYAEKSLEIQERLMSVRPAEGRKTVTRLAYIGAGFLVIFLSFVGFCLYLGKDQFILQFLQIIGYFITTALGYYFGRAKSKGDKSESSQISSVISDAEVIS